MGEPVMRLLGIRLDDRLVEFRGTHDLHSPVQAASTVMVLLRLSVVLQHCQ